MSADPGGSAMDSTLYVIPGSHAARGGMLMLEQKGIPYRVVTLKPGLHAMVVRARGFPGRTVPALRIDGHRVQTNREIARYLDELQPEPPLLPADPARREAVEEAERWGDEVLQPMARRLLFAASIRDPGEVYQRGADGRLGHLLSKSEGGRRRISSIAGKRIFDVSDESERQDRADLPAALDNVDALIGSGVLGGDPPNAADCIIAPCVALLTYLVDQREEIGRRPCGALADKMLPEPAPLSA